MANEATDRVRQVWDSQAGSWYAQRAAMLEASRPAHDWLVRQLDPKPGQRVLEIAAGPGETGFLVAPLLGDGRLLTTDLAPSMVDVARQRGAELGITNADYRVLDAQAMDLEDASFDGVICRWGFMLMPDPGAALRECRRVLKPGGRLAFAVFTGPDENPFAAIPGRALVAAGHLPVPGLQWRPGILALADRTRLDTLVRDAGLTPVRTEGIDMTWTFASADEYWMFLVDLTALGPLVRSLPETAVRDLRTAVDAGLARFAHDGRVALPSRCWGVLATV